MNQLREVHTYAFVNHPYQHVSDVLRRDPMGLVERATDTAADRARALVTATSPGAVEVDRQFVVELVSVTADAEGLHGPQTRLSLTWKASHHPDLFPTMEATLDLLTLGPRESQLDFVGKYRPAHGMVGSAIDKVIGHRIMDAAVHRFVESLAERLQADARQ